MSEANKQQLRSNIHLAQQMGAAIETVYGDDIAFQIAEFARLSGVSKIVMGRASARRNFWQAVPDGAADQRRAQSGYLYHPG